MHELDTSNSRANIAYVGETPWHGLGQKLPEGQPIEVWAREAGLEWEAKESKVYFHDGNDGIAQFPKTKVIYRSDTNAALSIVSSDYKVVQPKQIMDFYRELCEHNGFQMETAGSIRGGRKIWALAKVGNTSDILDAGDVIESYVLLATSFDRSLATSARFTSIRVVCNNTLSLATSGGEIAQYYVPHSAVFSPEDAKIELKIGDAWKTFRQNAELMAETPVTGEQARDILLNVWRVPKTATDKQLKSFEKTMARIANNFNNGPGANLATANGTLWGLLNAVTYEMDHARRARSTDNRLDSAWFGGGEDLKNRAYNLMVEAATA